MNISSFDEFYRIIDKLIKYSFDINSKSIQLADIINEAQKVKYDLEQKEKVVGLQDKDKLYGFEDKTEAKDYTLIYTKSLPTTKLINEFIKNLEDYDSLDTEEKKEKLQEIKSQIDNLRDNGVKPEHFIINKIRFDVWNRVEHNFSLTLKKLNIDSFINHIRLLKLKYKDEIDTIRNYYKDRQKIYTEISHIRANKDLSEDEINKQIKAQYNLLNQQIDPKIAPLLVETGKLINKLEFSLEELPQELSNTQKEEFEEFIPAISEYYIDQTYALSQGYSYSPVSHKLQKIQQLINKSAFIGNILSEIDTLNDSIEHLYLLHWIAESLLKDILKCFEYSCSIGRIARAYSYNLSQHNSTNFDTIFPAIKIRNDIAHNGLIWNPEKISFAITIYRRYIDNIVKEQNINLSKVAIKKEHRKMSNELKEEKTKEFIKKHFDYNVEALIELDDKLYKKLKRKLEKNFWTLSDEEKKHFNKQIKSKVYLKEKDEKDRFANEFFNLSYNEVEKKLIAYYEQQNIKFDMGNEEDRKKAKINTLYWAYKSKETKDISNAIKTIKNIIGQ